jgi:hypothetical protein
MLATVAVKVPVVWPAATITLAGTVTLVLLLDNVTLAPLDGAAADKVIVQLEEPGAVTVAGEHVNNDGTVGMVNPTVADCCWPLSAAVTLTLWALLTVPVVTENVPLVWPAAMVKLEGTDSAATVLLIATTVEPAAAWFSVTVQVLDALLLKLEGAQAIPVTCAGAVAVTVADCEPPL